MSASCIKAHILKMSLIFTLWNSQLAQQRDKLINLISTGNMLNHNWKHFFFFYSFFKIFIKIQLTYNIILA